MPKTADFILDGLCRWWEHQTFGYPATLKDRDWVSGYPAITVRRAG